MSDKDPGILDKYLHGDRPGRPYEHGVPLATSAAASAADAADDLGCFGFLRGVRDRALMLELRKADGSIMAIGYSWLERAEYNPEDGITLHLHGRTVRIKGRNLNGEIRPQMRLFQGIVRHRVPWVLQVADRELMKSEERGTVVESVEW